MSDAVVRDRTRKDGRGGETRTLTVDLPAPWVIHALLRSSVYVSHTNANVTTEVALATDQGYGVATIVPTDGATREERSFDDWFSGGPERVADKAAVTFRSDIHDVDPVVSAVRDALESIRPTYQDVTGGRDE